MSAYRSSRALERQREAAERQLRYNLYLDDLVLNSSPEVVRRYYDTLSLSQRQRLIAQPATGRRLESIFVNLPLEPHS